MFVPRPQMYLASEQAWKDPGVSRLGGGLNQQPDAGSELVSGPGSFPLLCPSPRLRVPCRSVLALPLPHTTTLRVRASGRTALSRLWKRGAAVGVWRLGQASSVFSGRRELLGGQAFLSLVTRRKGHHRAKQHSSPLDSHTVATHGAAHTHLGPDPWWPYRPGRAVGHPDLAETLTSHLTLGNHSLFIRDGSPS